MEKKVNIPELESECFIDNPRFLHLEDIIRIAFKNSSGEKYISGLKPIINVYPLGKFDLSTLSDREKVCFSLGALCNNNGVVKNG